MRIHAISRPLATSDLPTTGMLFSLWHATVQVAHPVHAFMSMDMPHCGFFEKIEPGAASAFEAFCGLLYAEMFGGVCANSPSCSATLREEEVLP